MGHTSRRLQRFFELQGGFYQHSTVPVLKAVEDQHVLAGMQWGLLPHWWKPRGKSVSRNAFQHKTFNARSETVHEKPAYRSAFKRRRCLMPASTFFEKGHYFSLPSGEAYCFAGLWEAWDGGEDGEVLSCTLLTTEPNDAVKAVGHHRMPVLLTRAEDCRLWNGPGHHRAGSLR